MCACVDRGNQRTVGFVEDDLRSQVARTAATSRQVAALAFFGKSKVRYLQGGIVVRALHQQILGFDVPATATQNME